MYISDHAYSKEDVRPSPNPTPNPHQVHPSPNPTPNPHQLLRMEGDILATLDFRQTTRSDRVPRNWQPAAGWLAACGTRLWRPTVAQCRVPPISAACVEALGSPTARRPFYA